MAGLLRLYHTLRPLRWNQWWYRVWHPLAKRLSRPLNPLSGKITKSRNDPQRLQLWTVPRSFHPKDNGFVFLNRRHRFENGIDWFFRDEGLLWQFNLQYFEWLYDESLSLEARLGTILDFCRNTRPGATMHAYPTSLRILAWIWLSLRYGLDEPEVNARLHQDADWLRRFPEYQLDGNHLFENGMALCGAGAYLGDERITAKSERILRSTISDQILNDGGHCEGSPMYHSLLLWRMLQCIEILGARNPDAEILSLLRTTASKMLGWLQAVCFQDGTWPAVNDAAPGIAPSAAQLFRAAGEMRIAWSEAELSDSGYRMIREKTFELFIDVGGIAPAWQPGHAHADTGNFCLHVRGVPIIVDTGCSSYADARIREYQRSTGAHNAVVIDGRSSSELWNRFRVGKRCRVLKLEEAPDRVSIEYLTANQMQLRREFILSPDTIEIRDFFPKHTPSAVVSLHFHPGIQATPAGVENTIAIECHGFCSTETLSQEISGGFNILLPAACLLHHVDRNLRQTLIRLRI